MLSNHKLIEDSDMPDLLTLAKLYANGVGKIWHNKSEAYRILSITYPRITRAHISTGTSLSSLPHEILDLFESVGINMWNARALIKANKAQGSAALVETAKKIKSTNKNYSGATLVSIFNLVASISTAPAIEQQKFNPEELTEAYYQGQSKSQCLSSRSAEAELSSERSMAIACDFVNLPAMVKNLFINQDLTFDFCSKVVELQRVYGRRVLVERATLICGQPIQQASTDEILCLLAGITRQSATVIPRLRLSAGRRKLILELHCQDSRFVLDRSNNLIKMVENGLASLIQTALASLGAKQDYKSKTAQI
jgi:hypothetical protein